MNEVLVLDDHETNLTLYSRVIANIPNATPVTYASAKAALAWSSVNDPVLVLVDQQMPEMTGLDFIRLFRELRGRSETPIIMITGDGNRELRREALRGGVSAFLNKPVDPIEFLAIASNVISMRTLRIDALARADELASQLSAAKTQTEARDHEVLEAMFQLAELRDPRLAAHMKRTAMIAERIGRRVGLAQREIDLLGAAARVHDIGKIGIPERIIFKNGTLNSAERTTARKHAEDGWALLKNMQSPLVRTAAEIAHSHHERIDGQGYPRGLRGEAIPIAARIVGLSDTFAAMTAHRPWREALSVGVVMEEIERMSGLAFEPRLVGALRDVMPEVLAVRAQVPDA